ncbi:MAG: 3-phosphoshikimate 1-carboxyvinyltransferase [Bdellovibrionaceae bacterium]|nr:3-phosphoshikimate 1-carboxyvinyltransferase [Pseudobdellovibrionaceae bacterium]NUM59286.1 3-phosphoshikimate 1-carboxyvinyltransferase [Pseudobdellovibrionaceae bacterium]
MKKSFHYQGTIPASKSILNRALICASYAFESERHKKLIITGDSSCDDVIKMKEALSILKTKFQNSSSFVNIPATVYDCGAAGTVLRFLSLRMSRIPGTHILKGSERLLQRPQQDLLDLFKILGINYEINKTSMTLKSEGWKNINNPILVQRGVSSQFASGLLLNAWALTEDLTLDMKGEPMSEGYLQMTIDLVSQLGMNIEKKGSQLIVKKNSFITQSSYHAESDLSSLFAVAAFSVLNGDCEFKDFPLPSLQPDVEFLDFFKKMKIPFEIINDYLKIKTTSDFYGLEANLKNCPDLFPVLAVLCAFAKTPSQLYGAPQLVYKESNRIAKVSELLNLIGVKNTPQSDGMTIFPIDRGNLTAIKSFSYDTDHDHRLAFAAALVKSQDIPINILGPEVVSKSFPEFWDVIKARP